MKQFFTRIITHGAVCFLALLSLVISDVIWLRPSVTRLENDRFRYITPYIEETLFYTLSHIIRTQCEQNDIQLIQSGPNHSGRSIGNHVSGRIISSFSAEFDSSSTGINSLDAVFSDCIPKWKKMWHPRISINVIKIDREYSSNRTTIILLFEWNQDKHIYDDFIRHIKWNCD